MQTVREQIEVNLPLKIVDFEEGKFARSILADKNCGFDPKGCVIESLSRVGKVLIFNLLGERKIISHFGMSGGWRLGRQKIGEKHTHLQFKTTDQKGQALYLAYVDPRRFGSMLFLNSDKASAYLQKLGRDIGQEDFDGDYVYSVLKKYPQRQIKPFLLDQKFFAGCGNYIACEICALAGIRPTRKAKTITKREAEMMALAAKKIIHKQIQNKGLTFSGGYSDAFGNKGQGVENLVVFNQKICGLCHESVVKKIVLAQRGTYYCPSCQK